VRVVTEETERGLRACSVAVWSLFNLTLIRTFVAE